MEEEKFNHTLKIHEEISSSIIEEYKKLLIFADSFKEALTKEKRQLPYHINVIDELHINENAHSRILLKLLQFRNTKGEYEILESLLSYIKRKMHSVQFKRIQFIKPLITQEEARIDLWIRDHATGYSVIFENKVYNAKDQEEQLSRYIDKTIEEGFKESNIFVIYLPSDRHEPADQSWGTYKEEFRERYINLSFRNDILTWIKGEIFPNIHFKDVYLNSAVSQYIDYLEGYFLLRTINNKMNMKLDKLISKHFELEKFNDPQERIKAIQEKIDDMQEVVNSMQSYKDRLRLQIFDSWRNRAKQQFPKLPCGEYRDYVDVSLIYTDGRKYYVRVNEEGGQLFCQVEFDKTLKEDQRKINDTKLATLKELLPEHPESENWNCIWKWFGHDDYDEVFNLFCKVVERCQDFMAKA